MTELSESLAKVKSEIAKVIVGQESMIEHLLVALLSNGHVIIEGVPGVAKTITAKLLARTISVGFSRIQFTPDLMPSDILGTSVFNVKNTEFEFKKGPIFSNFILIDEINRSPANASRTFRSDGRTPNYNGRNALQNGRTVFSSCYIKSYRTRRNIQTSRSAIG